MIEHYLTVTQLKKAYLDSEDGSFNVISEGLHPDDAQAYGFLPVISVMLTVAKHGIHFQQLYDQREAICLVQFLAQAWMHEKISGLPDVLTVSPELEAFYGISNAIRTVDPSGLIRCQTVKNQSYAASLRYAQENARYGLDTSEHKHLLPTTPDESLWIANQKLLPYPFYCENETPVYSKKPFSLIADRMNDFHLPRFFDGGDIQGWLSASTRKQPRMKQGMALYAYNDFKEKHNSLFVGADKPTVVSQLVHENLNGQDLSSRNLNLVYTEQIALEMSGFECLIKDHAQDFADIITEERLEQSKSLYLPLSMHTYEALMDRMFKYPSVFFPTTAKQFEGAFYCLEMQEPKCVIELVGNSRIAWQYRIFAIMDIHDRTHLVVVDQKYRFKAHPKPVCCHFTGTLDVGPGAMGLLMYQLNNLKKNPDCTLTPFYSVSVGMLLDEYDIWRNERDY